MLYYTLSIFIMIITFIIRKVIIKDNFYKYINNYLIIGYFFALISDFIYAVAVTDEDLGIYAFSTILIICIASLISMMFRKNINNRNYKLEFNKILVDKKIFNIIFILFLISSFYFLSRYIPLLVRLNFKFNVINAHEYSSQIINGIWGYIFILGISSLILVPYTDIKYKNLIIIYILLIYVLNTRRLYFVMCIMIILFRTLNTRKISLSKIFNYGVIFILFFDLTQIILNKTIYNKLVLLYDGFKARIYSIVMDPLVYIVGNISNIDSYMHIYEKNSYFLEKTLYPIYSILNNVGIVKEPIIPNPFFSNGLFRTNTIAFSTYYLSDGGILFALLIVLIIMIINEVISSYNTKFNIIIRPFLISCAFLSFRQNDYVLIYFYIVIITVWIASKIRFRSVKD